MCIIEDLKEDHESIRLVLEILEKMIDRLYGGKAVDYEDLSWVFEFCRDFIDRSHFGKEEYLLFPALEDAEVPHSPLEELVLEHDSLREISKYLRGCAEGYFEGEAEATMEIIDKGLAFLTFMNQHLEKEDAIIYPVAETILSKETCDRLSEKFEIFQSERLTPGRREELLDALSYLKDFY